MWRLAPFYVAVAAAPLLFGGIKLESQALLGILLGLGLIFTATWTEQAEKLLPRWLLLVILFFLIAPLIPLPFGVVKILSPERARLAQEFSGSKLITISVSPARTVQRLWELTLAAAAFVLARQSAARPGGTKRLAMTLAIALALLGFSDIWSRAHGRETVLGIWNITWGKGAGTFANRNHFANWIYIASLFCGAWALRETFRKDRKTNLAQIIFVAAATLFALAFALLSASRAGAAAFIAGLACAILSQRKKLQRESYGVAVSFVVIAVVVIALLFGEGLLTRLQSEQTGKSLVYKKEIWAETLSMAKKFPIFGAGAGSFVRVFDHYKTAYGDSTVLHAENDYVELALEYGFIVAIILLIGVFSAARKAFVPALVVFAVHASVEFVSFVPSNLMLAGALLGFAAGRSTTKVESKNIWPQIIAGAAILMVGVAQFVAWPFSVNLEIALFRIEAQRPETRPHANARLQRAVALDPLNWEARLERAWFDLAYSTNRAAALSNAWLTVRLNPLQGQIPLRFARHFASRDPDLAFAFLKAVNPATQSHHKAALDLAWEISHDPAQIWALTPNTVPTLKNVIYFAQAHKLPGILADAAQALEGRLPAETLARHFLEADRPEEALRLVEKMETFQALRLRALALERLYRSDEMVTVAQKLFALENTIAEGRVVDASHAQLLAGQRANPNDPAAALLLAEKTAMMAPADLKMLTELAQKFPSETRISYLLFRAQLGAGQTNAAAKTASGLVSRLSPP